MKAMAMRQGEKKIGTERELWLAVPIEVARELVARDPRAGVALAGHGGGTLVRVLAGDDASVSRWLGELFVAAEGLRGPSRAAVLSERLDAAPDVVFEAIGSAEGLSRWFASGGSLEARVGGSYSVQAGPARIDGTVREHVPGRALSLTWATQPCRQRGLPVPTLVSFAVAPEAGGSRITLVHSGFGDGPGWEGAYEEHAETWRWLLSNLVSVIDRGVDLRRPR